MKQYIRITMMAALIAGATLTAGARSAKRGVSENEFQFKAQIAAVSPGVSWYYNWGPAAGRYLADETSMEFVPMCWNGNYDTERIRTYCKEHPETKYLLGFNEPNFNAQAHMTPAEAAAEWPAVQALARELGLRLVAPALNYSPNAPYQSPTKWMDEFIGLVGDDAFDYLAVHSYGGFGVMRDLATEFHDRYGKDVWVTEFCLWPDEGNPNSYVSPEAQIACMVQSVEWLEKTEWIHRYAWFKAIGNSSADKGPNYGLLIPGKGEAVRELSEQGKVYVNMSDFDPDLWHPAGKMIPAVQYSASNALLLGSNTDAAVDCPIEITRFNAGAWADYQFDIPADGNAVLTLRVAGFGEPVRFDPVIGIYAVNADGTTGRELAAPRTLTLPDAADRYIEVSYVLDVTPGCQTIRIADANPSQPSGILISALAVTTPGGVDAVAADSADVLVEVYSMQGIELRRGISRASALDGLPAGFYIVGGEKVRK